MENEKFDLYEFTENLEKDHGHMKEDDLTDLEKAQLIMLDKVYRLDNVFRLYINEMAMLFVSATTDQQKYVEFIKRSAIFIQAENAIRNKDKKNAKQK